MVLLLELRVEAALLIVEAVGKTIRQARLLPFAFW